MWTYFSKWLVMATFCTTFSFASSSPTGAQTYTSKSALLASMWLNLKPRWPIVTFTMCLLKDVMGTDDVTDMQLLICARYLYPISKSKAAAHNVEDVFVAMHDWMHDLSFRWLHLIPASNFPSISNLLGHDPLDFAGPSRVPPNSLYVETGQYKKKTCQPLKCSGGL